MSIAGHIDRPCDPEFEKDNTTISSDVEDFQSFLPDEMKIMIFEYAFEGKCPTTLISVCKDWEGIIGEGTIRYGDTLNYFGKGSNFQKLLKACSLEAYNVAHNLGIFLNGKLQYRLYDEGKKTFAIADLTDPFNSTFMLPKSEKNLMLTTSPAAFFEVTKENHTLNVLMALHDVVSNNLSTTCKPFQDIMKNWDGVKVPIGIFFKLSSDSSLVGFDHFISENIVEVSSGNLGDLWLRAIRIADMYKRAGDHLDPMWGVELQFKQALKVGLQVTKNYL